MPNVLLVNGSRFSTKRKRKVRKYGFLQNLISRPFNVVDDTSRISGKQGFK